MKAIILSIRPNWCKLIWSGMKTVEVRKTRPKLETPFKVYIYCTGAGNWWQRFPIWMPIPKLPKEVEECLKYAP